MTNGELLDTFLSQYHIKEEFWWEINVNDFDAFYKLLAQEYDYFNQTKSKKILTAAFVWRESKQGHFFWKDINLKWLNFLDVDFSDIEIIKLYLKQTSSFNVSLI